MVTGLALESPICIVCQRHHAVPENGMCGGTKVVLMYNNILLSKLEDFDGLEEVAAEYSDVKTCPMSDVGYHCSCYDRGEECHICEQKPPEKLSIKDWGGH